MEIKPLSKEVITKIRSCSNISNLTQCVTELVLNSLDAKSSAVAIRLNSVSFRIQVIDNGIGISQENLEKIVHKYSTNKCQSLVDFEKKPNTYGCKGESLWTISNISKILNITSKFTKSENTFSKTISFRKHGKVTLSKSRQSNGTTVTVDGFFYNLPVRQKRMKKEFEFKEITNFLKGMSIIRPQISITLRDDISGKLIFKRPKSENILKSLTDLYPEIKYDETIVMKVNKDKITVEALLTKDMFKDKVIQHLYVNKRPVSHQKLQTFICRELTKDKKNKFKSVDGLNPMYIFNIKCSLSNFSVIYANSEAKVEFVNIDLIYRCIKKLILNFLGKFEPIKSDNEHDKNRKSVCGISDLVGTVKGFGFKDWLKKDEMIKETSGVIEDVIENNENLLEIDKPPMKPKIRVKKAKLNSLPIKIYDQKKDKTSKVRVEENNTRKSEINDHGKDNLQNKNKFIVPATPNEHLVEKVMIENFRRLEKNCRDITSKQKPDDTLFSHFTNTEEKGKDLIMYMFLKSTEIFDEDVSQEPPTQISEENSYGKLDSSRETIMESNIFLKNITKTKTHQLNKTISVSVRLKRRKKVKSYEEKPSFSEKYSFSIPVYKKRRIEYLNEAGNFKGRKHSISPYFKEKLVKNSLDKRIQASVIENLEGHFANNSSDIEMRNSLMKNGERRDILCSKQFYNQNVSNSIFKSCLLRNNNSKYNNMRKCFDQISIFNDCFMKQINQEKNILHDYNQSYLFNFASASITRNIGFEINPKLNQELTLEDDHMRSDRKYDFKSNLYLKNFDFGNLSLSPIPKKPPVEKFQNIELTGIFDPVFPEPQRTNVKKLRKHSSEGEFFNICSPYFSKEKKCESKNINNFSFSLINNDLPHNTIKGTYGMEKFRRYHTEPLEGARIQHIQNMKKNIDKIFMGWKCDDEVPYPNNDGEKVTSFTKKEEADIYTKDSLEHDNNRHKHSQQEKHKHKNKTPLWKKFIRKKHQCLKVDDLKKSDFVSDEKIDYKIPQNKSPYFERKFTATSEDNIVESPDLFSNVKLNSLNESYKKTVKNSTFLCNPAISFEVDALNDEKVDREKELTTLTAVATAKSSNLIITLNTVEENKCEKDTDPNTDDVVPNASLLRNEWTKKIDQEGKEFYFNEKSGITSFLYPRKEEIYIIKERPEFMPKGLSPLLIPYQKLEKSLSPISKEKLNDEILKSYVEDLGLIKWEKCIKGYDPKKFFETLYSEKVNEYEKEVPNVIKTKMPRFALKSSYDHKFNKMIFCDLRVIGQIDQKFIAAIDKKKFNLILFDQHAVHERIRLEELLKEYQGKSSSCENVTLFMNQSDVELLAKHNKYLNDIGIHFRFLKNGITVYEVPLCFLNKVTKEYPLPKLLQLFIRELLELVRDTRGVLTGLPKIMNQIINMEACRGSVKFGELLSREEMEKLIDQLSYCTLPFQCAHGRPTLIPLLTLSDIPEEIYPLPKLLQLFIRELLELVRDTRGVLTGLPKIMNQIINMEACRGSVKFGELLSREEMEKLIDQLSYCTLPFQCAHGRPTLIPLLTLSDIPEEIVKKPNLYCLKMR